MYYQSSNEFFDYKCRKWEYYSLLPNRISKNIIEHFERCYSLSSRKAVKSVVLDFNSSYHIFIKRLFPNAQIIADRFHLIQMLNRVTIQVRITTVRQFQ
ncbi:transposase [Pediococcus acidilactici]|uniref:transposase n=1 Tax=Pediococcus acidilactici TaxID=1254 RepID=UPI001951D8B6|nr:transposase [Pediococcus acidilactici]